MLTPKESNVYSPKRKAFQCFTPKESNVYSKRIFHPAYDSFGVEHVHECYNFYKHAIPSGLIAPQKHNKLIIFHLMQ